MGKSVKPQTHKQAFLPKSHHTRPGFNHQGLVQPWALEAKFLPKSKGVAWLPELFLNSNSKTLWWIAHPCSTHFLATRLFCFGMEKKNQKPQITWVLRHPHNIPTASGPFVVFVWVKPSPKMSRLLAGFRARNFWKKTRGVSVYPVMERDNPESPSNFNFFLVGKEIFNCGQVDYAQLNITLTSKIDLWLMDGWSTQKWSQNY